LPEQARRQVALGEPQDEVTGMPDQVAVTDQVRWAWSPGPPYRRDTRKGALWCPVLVKNPIGPTFSFSDVRNCRSCETRNVPHSCLGSNFTSLGWASRTKLSAASRWRRSKAQTRPSRDRPVNLGTIRGTRSTISTGRLSVKWRE
jgi:hypothetical protein